MTQPEDLDNRALVMLLLSRVCERVVTHPASTLAGAAAAGYVLGWSMPRPVYRSLASFAMRAAVVKVATTFLGSMSDDDEEEDSDERFDEVGMSKAGSVSESRKANVPPYVA